MWRPVPKNPPFPSPPTFKLSFILSVCLDAIQMFFFSTPLWREPTPIVHKINPMVPADPAQCTEHAHTADSYAHSVLDTYDQIQSAVSQQSNNCNTSLENPSSEDSELITKLWHTHTHTSPFSQSPLRPQLPPVLSCVFSFSFFEKGKLYRPVTSPNWLWLGGSVDILKWFMLKVERGLWRLGVLWVSEILIHNPRSFKSPDPDSRWVFLLWSMHIDAEKKHLQRMGPKHWALPKAFHSSYFTATYFWFVTPLFAIKLSNHLLVLNVHVI